MSDCKYCCTDERVKNNWPHLFEELENENKILKLEKDLIEAELNDLYIKVGEVVGRMQQTIEECKY